jgi:DNA-binding IclR family transcriptional regulator
LYSVADGAVKEIPVNETRHRTGGSSTLNRALEVLQALAEGPEGGMTAAQLAAVTASNRVSVHRILGSFVAHGLVRQEQPGAPYRLGFRLLELAQSVIQERELVPLAYPLLEELTERSGETSHLAVPDGGEAVYVAKFESPRSIRLVSHVGVRVPLYCTALGKALLAAADDGRRERLMALQSFERRTPRTKTSAAALRADLDVVRKRGYAVDDVENEEGVRCIGAAVLDHTGGPIAAISVSGPTTRVTKDEIHTIGRLAADVAARLSAAMGHDGGEAHRRPRS